MPQTSPGLLQRPAMRFFYVAWNRVKYRAGLKLIRLTEYKELMHSDISQARVPGIEAKTKVLMVLAE